PADQQRVLEVWNKIDQLDESDRDRLLRDEANQTPPVAVSAITGEGLPDLLRIIEERISGKLEEVEINLSAEQGSLINWVYENGQVVAREYHDDGSVTLRVRATEAARSEFTRRLS